MKNSRLSINSTSKRTLAFLFVAAFCVILQFASRYLAEPFTDFVLDDWSCLAKARNYASYESLAKDSWQEKSRPLVLFSTIGLFKLFDDQPEFYAITSMVIYSLIIALLCLFVRMLTGSLMASLLAGVFFALMPNLTESFHWGQLTGMAWIYAVYFLMLIGWLRFMQTSRHAYLVLSASCYLMCAFAYEIFFVMPLALLSLVDFSRWKYYVKRWLIFPVISAAYLAWRFTGLFGIKLNIQTFDSTREGLDFSAIIWSTRQIAGWWIGDSMLQSIAYGLMGFVSQSPREMMTLVMLNMIIAGLFVFVVYHRGDKLSWLSSDQIKRFGSLQIIIFGLFSAAMAAAPSLVSWTSGRQNYLVATGLAIAIGCMGSIGERKKWISAAFVIMLICLCVNQGTNLQWRDNGKFNRALFDHITATKSEWLSKEVIFLETAHLRNRFLFSIHGKERTHAGQLGGLRNGNAEVLRGFVPTSMVSLLNVHGIDPACVMDSECGAIIKDNSLIWHRRFDPGHAYITPIDRVFIIDAIQIAEAIN